MFSLWLQLNSTTGKSLATEYVLLLTTVIPQTAELELTTSHSSLIEDSGELIGSLQGFSPHHSH